MWLHFLLAISLLLLQVSPSTINLRQSPIDTQNDCYWSNRIYQKELRKEEETPIISFIEIEKHQTDLYAENCLAQIKQSDCVTTSQIEYKQSRKPLSQCGWCIKDEKEMCTPCSQVRAKEVQGYVCSPNTNVCYHPPGAEDRGGDSKPRIDPKPTKAPKPDASKPCATAPGADPCEVSKSKPSDFSIGSNLPASKKQRDPNLPEPEPALVLPGSSTEHKKDDPVLPEEREIKEQNDFDEPIRYGAAVIPWNHYRFCERVVKEVAPKILSEEISKSESPDNDFTAVCLSMFGNVCIKKCRTLSILYDEASRPGANEIGGLDGNNNMWDRLESSNGKQDQDKDQGRWDTSRSIPTNGLRSGEKFGPTFVRNKRILVYQMTQEDCMKCIKEDDCVPDCLDDGSCNGENDKDIDMDDEAMDGIQE